MDGQQTQSEGYCKITILCLWTKYGWGTMNQTINSTWIYMGKLAEINQTHKIGKVYVGIYLKHRQRKAYAGIHLKHRQGKADLEFTLCITKGKLILELT